MGCAVKEGSQKGSEKGFSEGLLHKVPSAPLTERVMTLRRAPETCLQKRAPKSSVGQQQSCTQSHLFGIVAVLRNMYSIGICTAYELERSSHRRRAER